MYCSTLRYLTTSLAILLLFQAAPGLLRAAETEKPPVRRAVEVEKVEPKPASKKHSFFGRLFGDDDRDKEEESIFEKRVIDQSKIKRAIATASPSPTPKAKPTPKPKSTAKPAVSATPASSPTAKPKPKSTASPEPTAEPNPTATATPKPEPTSTPGPEESANFETAPAFVPADRGKTGAPSVEEILSEDYQEKMQTRYDEVKAKAAADPAVAELKDKSDIATPGQEKEPMNAYYKALFGKMRELDPQLGTRIDRIENATLRRIEKM